MVEQTVQEKADNTGKPLEDMTLDELEELEDEQDERILLQYRYNYEEVGVATSRFILCCYRQQRMAEILAIQQKAKFGSVKEISAVDYVDEVNKAGEGVWVLLHLYKTGQVLKDCPKPGPTLPPYAIVVSFPLSLLPP